MAGFLLTFFLKNSIIRNGGQYMTSTLSINKPKLSFGIQAIATGLAIIAAIALPQLLHVLGKMSGLGKGLG